MLNYQRVSSMTDDLWIFIALMALDHLWLIMASPAIFCGCINFPLPGKVREIPAKTVWNLGCFRWAHVLNPGTKTSRNHAKLQRKTIPHAHPFTCSHPISPKFWSGRISKDQLDPQRGKFWGRPSLGALSVAEEILSTPISWMKWQQRRCLGPPPIDSFNIAGNQIEKVNAMLKWLLPTAFHPAEWLTFPNGTGKKMWGHIWMIKSLQRASRTNDTSIWLRYEKDK